MEHSNALPKGISDLEKQIAKQYTGKFAWPTLLLAVGNFSLFLFTCAQCIQGNWPLWLGLIINTVLAYVAFTPQHDAMHGAISGVKGKTVNLTWADHLVGWMCTLVLGLPFTYRVLHLRHHTHTNDPENDIDYYAHTNNIFVAFLGPIRQFKNGFFILKAMNKESMYRKQFRLTGVWLALQLSVIIAAVYLGFTLEIFLLWIIPGFFGLAILSVLFQWLPHHPHSESGRYTNTRVTLFPGGTFLLLGQNTHLIHHMFPRIPFYNYPKVFKTLRPELEQRGAKIDTLL